MNSYSYDSFRSSHIPNFLPHPTHQIHTCPEQACYRIHVHCFMPKFVVPFNHGSISMCRDAAHTATAILGQAFIQQVKICLLANLEPHVVIIILLDVFYLKQTHSITVSISGYYRLTVLGDYSQMSSSVVQKRSF